MGWPDSSTNHTLIFTPSHLEPSVVSCLSPFPLLQIAETEDARIVREFAQIIDTYEAYHDTCGEDAVCLVPSISDRFMGMRSAIITNNSSLKTFGGKLGCTVLQLSDIIDDNHPNADLPIDVVASELLKLLGFQEGKTSETSRFDLVFIHIGDGENNSKKDTEYVNHLVGQIMHIADTGSEISSRLHMSVVMSYGTVSEDDDTNLSFVCGDGNNSDLTLLFPCQSYMVKGRNLRNNVRYHSPMLLAQWQNAVTRKDVAETFSFKDFKEHGGILTIPADRFIHEIAFKLWKAPKYGA
ncbi:Urease accessory protein like [Actinidia chinensis var. chinensis]|uniref:Urease accessory protein like n=1 Tax=Actinidia chinensis var. chinensis TaxID=1590841 RepID=A0A2R6PD80_ACTCC|nr:Urease accessory protein like [Actinidia chinensis var. chinensis]